MASFPLFYCYMYHIYANMHTLVQHHTIIYVWWKKNRKNWHKTPTNENEMSIFSQRKKWKYFADVPCSNAMKIIFSIKFTFFCFISMNLKNICEFNLLKAIKEPNYTDSDEFFFLTHLPRGDLYSIYTV